MKKFFQMLGWLPEDDALWRLLIDSDTSHVQIFNLYGNMSEMHIDRVPQFLSQQKPIPDHIVLDILTYLPPSQILARKQTPLLRIAEQCTFLIKFSPVETPRHPAEAEDYWNLKEMTQIRSDLESAAKKEGKGVVVQIETYCQKLKRNY